MGMGLWQSVLAVLSLVGAGAAAARLADVDLVELLAKHPFSGGTIAVVGIVGAFNAGQIWRRDKQMKSDVAHIKANMLTEEKLENALLKFEDKLDDKYVSQDAWARGQADKSNGHIRGDGRGR